MALTVTEKREWVEYLLNNGNVFFSGIPRKLTPEYLEVMARKTDEEVRDILDDYKAQRLDILTKKKEKIELEIQELGV